MTKEKIVKVTLLLRRDTLDNWQTNNPVLRAGEMSYVTDLGRCKIGDGTTAWNDLPYFALMTDLDDNASIVIKSKSAWELYDKEISKKGIIYVYTSDDISDGSAPLMKIGDGLAYICDLPFITSDILEKLEEHKNDTSVHITEEERTFWNNKINILDINDGVINNILTFNRK